VKSYSGRVVGNTSVTESGKVCPSPARDESNCTTISESLANFWASGRRIDSGLSEFFPDFVWHSAVVAPEPRRLLIEWAEKYKERYRWRLRSSFETSKPLGKTPAEINPRLQSLLTTPYVFTGAAAATDAPFIDLDRIDIFLLGNQDDAKLRELSQPPAPQEAPKLRFIYPYDEGVFLFCRRDPVFPKVSSHRNP
jgi:hypothetical protein